MKQKALILTQWQGDGLTPETGNRPVMDYAIDKFEDVTGQDAANLHPNPNAYIVYIEAEDTVMAQIVADDNYPVLEGYPIDIPEEVI